MKHSTVTDVLEKKAGLPILPETDATFCPSSEKKAADDSFKALSISATIVVIIIIISVLSSDSVTV